VTRPPLAWGPVGAVMAVLAVLLGTTITRYDYHRDELYFRMLGEHPAWGYVDQPPATPLLARLAIEVFGDTVWAIRIPALLCVLGVALLAALIAREVGGGALAQGLAAAGTVSTFPLLAGHLLVTATLDLVVWAGVTLLVMRALLRDQPRWWLPAGALVGVALYNKHLVVLLLLGLAAGLLLVGPRRVLLSPWLWAGVGLAVLIGLPNLVYQIVNDFPQLDMAAALAENKGDEARVMFVPMQILALGPPLAAVWIVGLVRLWRDPDWRPIRSLAVAYPVICVILLAIAGQFYYTLGLLVALYAIGCVPLARWLTTRARIVLAGALGLLNVAVSVLVALPLLPLSALGGTPIPGMNQAVADQVGWPAYVRTVAAAHATLTDAEKARAVIVTGNYGEAGSLDRYGRRYGLPRVYSGQNELHRLGPPPASADVVIVVFQEGQQLLARAFDRCEITGHLDNGVGVDNEEQGAPVRVCRGLRSPWSEMWREFQHFD